MTARTIDDYGFLIIKNNPIATAGVFGYWGEEIGLPPKATMYQVLRTPEMLQDAAHLFDGKPVVLEHTFVGEERNATPAEQKGIDGALSGASVSNGTLTADITIYTGRGKRFIEQATAKRKSEGRDVNLSLGYLAMYEMQSGVWQGQNYDVLQTIVTANHLAILSGNGRAGDAVAMLDGEADNVSSIDFKILDNEELPVDENTEVDENQAEEDQVDAAQTATIQSLSEQLNDLRSFVEKGFADLRGAAKTAIAETEDESNEDDEDDEDDEDNKKVSTEDGAAAMSALAIKLTAAHAAAVAVVKPFVQYDWAKLPTAKEVWSYAAKKLELSGDAETAVRTYALMQTRKKATADGEATKTANTNTVKTTGTWEAK
jgi:hypothetical protein